MNLGETIEVTNRKEWRSWLARHYGRAKEIWLVYFRKTSGKPRISYNDAVEEALCYGWIDSTVKGIDGDRFAQRFSPRRRTSGLSQMNKERIHRLIARHKMTKTGLAAVAHVFDSSAEGSRGMVIPPDIIKAVKADRQTWANFQRFPESYRRIRTAYVESGKRRGPAEYRRRLDHFLRMTAKNKRFGYVREMWDYPLSLAGTKPA
jgi:uncharacterized protein YdeI (YjbR/CyaY-like superfamily)